MHDHQQSPAKAGREAWIGLGAISLGVALVVIDFTIVNVVMPSIIDDLAITSVDAQWIQESYAIILAALLLLVGRLSDRWGARRLFLVGSALFAVASVAAALSPGAETLILSRAAQGVGGALVLPTSLSLINATFHGADRAKAFAVWGSTIGAGAAVGPLLGGWLAEISWRWAFGINIVLIVVILLAVGRFVGEAAIERQRIDVLGGVLSVAGLGLLAFGLVEGRSYGWLTALRPGPLGIELGSVSVIPVVLGCSAIALAAFVVRQRALTASGASPLMDTRLFSIRSFSTGNVASFVIGVAEFGLLAVLPLWLHYTLGYSAVQTGLVIVVVALGSFVASGASFGVAERTSAITLVRIGLVLEALGLLLFAVVARSDSGWLGVSLALAVYGAGVGLATAQVTNVVLAEVPQRLAGQGSGVQSTARQLGSALGIAVLTSTFFIAFASDLTDRLDRQGAPRPATAADGIADSAGAAIAGLEADPATQALAEASREAMTFAIQVNGYVSALLLLVGLAVTFLIPSVTGPSPAAREEAPADQNA